MSDLIYLGVAVVLLLLTWGLMWGCETLQRPERGEQS